MMMMTEMMTTKMMIMTLRSYLEGKVTSYNDEKQDDFDVVVKNCEPQRSLSSTVLTIRVHLSISE